MSEKVSKEEVQALISHLERLIHDLGQPLLAIRFAVELVISGSEMISKKDLAVKMDLISQAIEESSSTCHALSEDLQKLKKFI